MGKIKKRGTSGQAKNFITRTQAVRKLQVSLPDFRRLCIFKGIYPREPRNKRKASKSATPATTFYYTKDIQYLLHEPLLQKFRDHKAVAKKIGRHLGRGEVNDAQRLEKTHTPRLTLDHVIKERYPTFVDALRDLDDALSMLFLFANLPSTTNVPPKINALCRRLCHEFEHYLILSNSLRKSFLSIKGIYYQATIQGQDILWLVPYKFVQRISGDIDFRIMATFVEFYTTLLGFVNYRLYTSIGLIYPPKFDTKSDEKGAELGAFQLEGRAVQAIESSSANGHVIGADDQLATERAQAAANALERVEDEAAPQDEEQEVSAGIDAFTVATAADADVLQQPGPSSNETSQLFANFTVFISREAPRHPLELLLRAFGCKRVGWDSVLGEDGFTTNESDPSITHQIVDRPPQVAVDTNGGDNTVTQRGRIPGRTYIQPQWIWDCVNAGKLLRPDLYAPGAELPPHLSPFVKPKPGAYDPTAPLPEEEEAAIERQAEEAVTNGDVGDISESEDDEEDAEEDITVPDIRVEDDWGGLSGSEDDADGAARQLELEAEAAGKPVKTKQANAVKKAASKIGAAQTAAEKERAEHLERQKLMMPRRKRKLYERMEYSNNQRSNERQKLESKRRRLAAAAK